jgi:hypothetical protein
LWQPPHPSSVSTSSSLSRGEHCLVPPLHDDVLLRHVRHGEVMLHALILAVARELDRGELAALVGVQHSQATTTLVLGDNLHLLDRDHNVAL